MNHRDAVAFLRPALAGDPGPIWADLGAGRGTFTKALAELLGPDGAILALDRDPAAVRALRRLAREEARREARQDAREKPREEARQEARGERSTRVVPARGDVRHLDAVPELGRMAPDGLDGVLFANVLHFFPDPESVLADVVRRLRRGGRIVVIEYEGRSSSPWIPHPVPADRLRSATEESGLPRPRVVATRDSAFRGSMYCAVIGRELPSRP